MTSSQATRTTDRMIRREKEVYQQSQMKNIISSEWATIELKLQCHIWLECDYSIAYVCYGCLCHPAPTHKHLHARPCTSASLGCP